MKIVYLRQEDYWIFPLSTIGVLLMTVFIYMGSSSLKLIMGLVGAALLYFGTYIINKNYTKRHAVQYIITCSIASLVLAGTLYWLTK